MNIDRYKFVALAGLAIVAGCSGSADQGIFQMPSDGKAVETVNGTPVPQSSFEVFAKQHRLDIDKRAERDHALKLITDYVLMAQEAKREGWTTDPEFRAQVEIARLQGMADAAFRKLGDQTPISDSILKSEYDAEVKKTGKVSYDFTQLLFGNQDDAIKAEGEILSGKPFSKVYDEWRGKVKQARSFTRVRLDQIPPALARALAGLKNGDTTKIPVKTQFGWHVVHLDIANPFTPPPFDQVKDGIRRSMQVKIARQRLDKLREQATVTYPPGSAPPAPAKPKLDGAAGKSAPMEVVSPAGQKPEPKKH